MNNGTRCFLEQSDWITIPWALAPDQKSSSSYLIDIFCSLPGLIEDRKHLKIARTASFATSAPSAELKGLKIYSFTIPLSAADISLAPRTPQDYQLLVKTLHERLFKQLRALEDWKESWDEANPSAVSSLDHASFRASSYDLPSELFGSALEFPDLLRAKEYTLYNTILFSLLSILFETRYGWLSPNPYPDNVNPPLPNVYVSREQSAKIPDDIALKRCQAAVNICRAVPYHLLFEKHGCGGAYLMMFPLMIAQQHFTPPWTEMPTQEAQWIKGVLRHIADRWGLGSMYLVDD